MGWFSGIVVFIIIWWWSLFMVLPFGHQRDENGTPVIPYMKRKIIITTAITCALWLMIYLLIKADVISFLDMAKTMHEEDSVRL